MSFLEPNLSNYGYDQFRRLLMFVYPAIASGFFVIALIIGIPGYGAILGGMAFFSLGLGFLLWRAKASYLRYPSNFDGDLVVVLDGGGVRTFSLEVMGDPDELAEKDVISFRVMRTGVPEPPLV